MEKISINTFEQAVEYLYSVPLFTTKNSLEDTRLFLKRLGNPDKKMKIIHVAGTNGKGSVCTYMRNLLEAAGFTTAVFTSPHLIDIRERFLIKGQIVDKKEFLDKFLYIYDILDWEELSQNRGYHPTFFEYIFFIGMLLFEANPTDYVILETGLGGRLDATNAVTQKEISVITRISFDHVQYLGYTLKEIAGEKAGIIASNTKVVFADTQEEITEVIKAKAIEGNCDYYAVSQKDYSLNEIRNKSIDFSLCTRYYDYIGLAINTVAVYQMENAALAVRAIEELLEGQYITKESIKKGLSQSFWSGRMEEVWPEVYVDGAHNEDGIRAFLDTVKAQNFHGKRKLLFGVMKDKDYSSMIKQIENSGLFDEINLTKPKGERALTIESLKLLIEENFAEMERLKVHNAYDDIDTALSVLLPLNKGERLYIAGSLYLVGEVLSKLK